MITIEKALEKVDLKRYKSSRFRIIECKEEVDQEEQIIKLKIPPIKYLSKQLNK